MGLYAFRDLRLLDGQIIEFVDHGDIDIHGTGLAVSAVGTLSCVGVKRSGGDDGCIILLILRGCLVGKGFVHLLFAVISAEDGGHAGSCQGIVDQLLRGEGGSEGGGVGVEKASAEEALHDGHANLFFLTEMIKGGSFRVDAGIIGAVIALPHGVQVFRGRPHVKGRIDGEQDHLDKTGLHRLHGHPRIVGGQADVADHAFIMELMNILDVIRVQAAVPFLLGIDVVDHTQIDIVGLQSFQQIFKSRNHMFQLPGTGILLILPGGTDMALDQPFLTISLHALSDDISGFGIRHPAVDDIDAFLPRIADQFHGLFFVVALQPLSSESDLTDKQTCFSKLSVVHGVLLSLRIPKSLLL